MKRKRLLSFLLGIVSLACFVLMTAGDRLIPRLALFAAACLLWYLLDRLKSKSPPAKRGAK